MTDLALKLLNQAELMHIAAEAERLGDFGRALAYLKEAADRPDAGVAALHLLGAHCAALRLYPQARVALRGALARDPALPTVRVQLALLELGNADVASAQEVLAPLLALAPEDAFYHFGHGLTALAADQLALARTSLEAGIARNRLNPPLNADMRKIIDAVGDALAEAPHAGATQHLVLAAYAGSLVPPGQD